MNAEDKFFIKFALPKLFAFLRLHHIFMEDYADSADYNASLIRLFQNNSFLDSLDFNSFNANYYLGDDGSEISIDDAKRFMSEMAEGLKSGVYQMPHLLERLGKIAYKDGFINDVKTADKEFKQKIQEIHKSITEIALSAESKNIGEFLQQLENFGQTLSKMSQEVLANIQQGYNDLMHLSEHAWNIIDASFIVLFSKPAKSDKQKNIFIGIKFFYEFYKSVSDKVQGKYKIDTASSDYSSIKEQIVTQVNALDNKNVNNPSQTKEKKSNFWSAFSFLPGITANEGHPDSNNNNNNVMIKQSSRKIVKSSSTLPTSYAFKLFICGHNNTGKNSLVDSFFKLCSDSKAEEKSYYQNLQFKLDNKQIKMVIRQHHVYPNVLKFDRIEPNASIAIIVFDITNNISFDKAKYWVDEVLQTYREGTPVIMVGNKLDLESERQCNPEEINSFIEKVRKHGNDISYIETSAVTSKNIDTLIINCVDKYMEKNQALTNKNVPALRK